jgi:hypothetical protein
LPAARTAGNNKAHDALPGQNRTDGRETDDYRVAYSKEGKLKHLIGGVSREISRQGRVFAFPLRKLVATISAEGCQLTLTTNEEFDHEVQVSANLTNWTRLTTLKFAPLPTTVLDPGALQTGHRFYRVRAPAP